MNERLEKEEGEAYLMAFCRKYNGQVVVGSEASPYEGYVLDCYRRFFNFQGEQFLYMDFYKSFQAQN